MRFANMRRLSSLARYYLLIMLLVASTFLSGLQQTTSVNAAIGSVTQYSMPSSGSVLSNIGAGPDGNIWYTSYGPSTTTRVGKVTPAGSFDEYLNRTVNSRYPGSITTGSDGNVWYSEYGPSTNNESRIVKISTSGTVLDMYVIGYNYRAESLVLGPNGDLWFAYNNQIGRISTSGITNFYTAPYGTKEIKSVTTGPDGNIWYVGWGTSSSKHSVGKMTPSGVFTNYLFASSTYGHAQDITNGPDGNLWFTMPGIYSIFKMTTGGVMTQYPVGANSWPYAITTASDDNLWYVGSGRVGKITTAGTYTEFSVSGITTGNNTKNIVSGSDGAVWVYDSNYNGFTRVAVELATQEITFTSTAPSNAVVDGPTYKPTASSNSGLSVSITIDPSSSTVCSIDGSGVVSFQSAGVCTINANQAGDADHEPALQVQQSFAVAPVESDTSVDVSCPSTAVIASTITCTLTVSNTGEAVAKNLKLTILTSDSITNISLSNNGVVDGQEITWTMPSLAPNDSVVLTFDATASVASRASISASLLQTNPDFSIVNNVADAKVKIQ